MITAAERRFRVRVRISVPPGGVGQRYAQVTAWLDGNCGSDGWAMTPSGTRNVLNDAVSIYFADATLASASVARWCAGAKVETAGGVAGNITKFVQPSGSTSLTYNSVNEVTAAGAQPFAYDAAGNLVSDGARTYAWDAENRLVGITYAAQPGKKTNLAYDGLDRRVAIATTASGTTTTADYIWCGSRICQSRNGTSTVNRLYYDEGEAIPASQALFYYGPDQLGSVRDVYATSPVFSMAQSYNYDPYGNPTLMPATGPLTDFRYAGMFYHADSGLYLTQYRAYDPRTTRWLSRDPIGETGGVNLYPYVEDNPLIKIDPKGLTTGSVGGGGSYQLGPYGGSASTSVGADSYGNVCVIFEMCSTSGLGFSGSVGGVGSVNLAPSSNSALGLLIILECLSMLVRAVAAFRPIAPITQAV
jgi:RHS repeat-associated protein